MSVGEPEKRETRAGPTVAVMQPYFMPYIGYYQLIAAADLFVVYDQIKYTKKGWINRNRMLVDGRDAVFTLPLRHDDDAKDVADRQVAETFDPDKLLRRMAAAYRRAPCFTETFAFLERVLGCPERNLFRFLFASLQEACRHLEERNLIRKADGQYRIPKPEEEDWEQVRSQQAPSAQDRHNLLQEALRLGFAAVRGGGVLAVQVGELADARIHRVEIRQRGFIGNLVGWAGGSGRRATDTAQARPPAHQPVKPHGQA